MIDEFSSRPHCRAPQAGNAIVEYVMPVAMILVLSIGAITAIGAALNGDFDSLKGNMQAKVSNASQQDQMHQLQKNAFQAAQASSTKAGGSGGAAGGSSAFSTAGLSPSDIAKVIQTAGANGATETLAQALDKYIAKLKADGTLTPDQLNTLTQLANAGHDMANAEKALQDAVSSGQSTVTYNGKSYSVADFGNQFGMSNGNSGVAGMLAANANPQTAPFLNLYAQAQANGSLSDPAVKDQVGYLSQQITVLSQLAEGNIAQGQSTTNQSYGYTTVNSSGAYMGITPSTGTSTISGATHGDSSGICGAGTGTDSGTSCN